MSWLMRSKSLLEMVGRDVAAAVSGAGDSGAAMTDDGRADVSAGSAVAETVAEMPFPTINPNASATPVSEAILRSFKIRSMPVMNILNYTLQITLRQTSD